jgi:hypothetical protein
MAKKGQTKASASKRSKAQRKYNSKPEQKKNRAARNKARRAMEKKGKVRKGDGKDVGHKTALKNGGSKSTKNTKVQSQKSNRSHGGKIGDKKKKAAGGRKGGKK